MAMHLHALDSAAGTVAESDRQQRLPQRIANALATLGRWLLHRAAPGAVIYALTDRDLADLNLSRWEIGDIRHRENERY